MKIIADENIPYAREAFTALGDVSVVPGRRIDAGLVQGADVLVVRSVTNVEKGLLNGSSVRFVGTVTIGTDHIDLAYLRERGIGFSSAPGSNANSVAEYVVAALFFLGRRLEFFLKGKTLGIIGVGNIGSRVAKKAAALGMEVLLNDPPLERRTSDPKYLPLEALMNADILTFHTPLTREGSDPTYHIVDEKFLNRMKKDAILINTSRGAVVEARALKDALKQKRILGAALDVWEDEPHIDMDLLKAVAPATTHIAGYSLDGKVNGTLMVYEAACKHLGMPARWKAPKDLLRLWRDKPTPEFPLVTIEGRINQEIETIVARLVEQVYDIEKDDGDLRRMFGLSYEQRGCYFDRLRKEYPIRREFFNTTVKLPDAPEGIIRTAIPLSRDYVLIRARELKKILEEVGFKV